MAAEVHRAVCHAICCPDGVELLLVSFWRRRLLFRVLFRYTIHRPNLLIHASGRGLAEERDRGRNASVILR